MNVLLVVLDSVRAANCSLYGYRRATTPTLQRLAAESVVYDQARAPANWSLPSHVSLFTGYETHRHEVTVDHRLAAGHTVFETLAAAGYETGLFSENGFLTSPVFGLADAFDTVVGVPDSAPDQYLTGTANDGPDGFYYADRLCGWLDDRDGSWAACLNLMDSHRPFEPRSAHDRWGDDDARDLQAMLPLRWEPRFHSGAFPYWQLAGLERLYDGGIRQADAVLDRVVTALRDREVLEETLLVVCSDHGDGFGEPGYLPGEPPAVSHIVPMHESLLHVPLVVRPPGGAAGRRVTEPVSLAAFPEAVARAQVGKPASFRTDRPVVAAKQPITGDLRAQFERACNDPEPLFAPSRAVYDATATGVRKTYVWGEAVGTLACPAAGQTHDGRLQAVPSPAAARGRLTEAFAATPPVSVRCDRTTAADMEETKAQLQALGYF